MTFDPTPATFGHFMLGKCSEQSGGGPALLVGTFGKLGPDYLDGRKPQLVEDEAQPLAIDVIVLGHVASPSSMASYSVMGPRPTPTSASAAGSGDRQSPLMNSTHSCELHMPSSSC